ncbi:MAG: extracellular solute-binding protein, partial [Pseudomonadota bacterium]
TINGPWMQANLLKNKIDYGIAPIPSLNGKKPKPFVGTHGFIIRRSSPNRALAKEFVEKYLLTQKGIMALYQKDPRGPSRKDVLEELSKKDENLKQFMASAQNGVPMPNVPEMGVVWTAVGSALSLVLSGQEKPKEALTKAKAQIVSSLKK